MNWFSEDATTRAEWLASLKPGDVVAVRCGAFGMSEARLSRGVIKNITPKRTRFDLMGGASFNARGSTRVSGRYAPSDEIEPWTEEVRETIVYRNALRRCKDAEWKDLPKDLVLQVSDILREHEVKQKSQVAPTP